MSDHQVARLRPGPLGGTLILDLSRILAGPYCTLLLHELGARIIKVEPPQGDDSRAYGPFQHGDSLYFAAINRGKESIALDLKQPEDRAIFQRLLQHGRRAGGKLPPRHNGKNSAWAGKRCTPATRG